MIAKKRKSHKSNNDHEISIDLVRMGINFADFINFVERSSLFTGFNLMDL